MAEALMLTVRLSGYAVFLAFIGVGLMVVRRRFPAVSMLGLSALMGLQPLMAQPPMGLLTAVAAYTFARQTEAPRRRAGLLLAAVALAMLACFASAPDTGIGSRSSGLALGAVLAATTVLVPGLVGTAGGQQDRLLQALRERAAAAEEARRLADSESRMHERSRIAAEMHDLVGHRLSLISLHVGGLEMALREQSPQLREEASMVRRATREAMQELRQTLRVLGPLGRDTGTDVLTDATGTRSDIEALVEDSRGGGIPVEFSWQGEDLDARPARVRRAVHRVVRESLTNVHRYAAGAHVTVAVTHADERVGILVRNGVADQDPAAPTGLGSGRGLIGLRERVTLLGGTFEAGSMPGGGFTVAAEIPADPGSSGVSADAAPYEAAAVGTVGPASGLSRVQRRFTSAVTGLLGLVCVSLMMLFGVVMVHAAQPGLGHHLTSPQVGMSKQQVEHFLTGDDSAVRALAFGHEPERPESATDCLYPYVRSKPQGGRLAIVRYCFRSDTLIAIDRFTVPTVAERPHESRAHD
ncbi:histidine kinase [Streptomyces sp. NPDC048506]|uniref:sensor histidine kinase n=1 Tax=Streptomyces sp. NPDC048506 TaxID=3155028 RepID=UPI00343391AD